MNKNMRDNQIFCGNSVVLHNLRRDSALKGKMMKRIVLACLGIALFSILGCQMQGQKTAIIGTWECTNFKSISHVAHFAKAFVKFGEDGVRTSWYINDEGKRIDEPPKQYHFDGEKIWDDEDTTMVWKVSFSGDNMSITTMSDSNPDNVGFELKHRRVKE